uniref:Uncharacterized protein n=1 Tax=Romanomermis culicivorax TaxID=13658 RepID=A0A915HEE8_ROMCU
MLGRWQCWGAIDISVQYRHVIQKKRRVIVATAAIEALTNNDLRRRQNVSMLFKATANKVREQGKNDENDAEKNGINN